MELDLDLTKQSLPVYEALASRIRLNVLQLLAERSMNIKELAESQQVSSAIMTKHVQKLEKAGLIDTTHVRGKAGVQKMCSLRVRHAQIAFPNKENGPTRAFHESHVSVGHFTDFYVEPTCGLATPETIVGEFDEPRYFLDPMRVNARILWFYKGFVEYKLSNFIHGGETPKELEISMELSSEAPFTNDNWPSDVSFTFNGVSLGYWRSPGDFGDQKGKYTPAWWPRGINQYGLLKVIRITETGTFIDGKQLSDVKLADVSIREKVWTFRVAVGEEGVHIGGVTLFGSSFGNYDQDIVFRLYYE
ncbi:ArsR/SmtB family transcription factor [Shouchella clausii]|uniref:ArsR/SmtB family transcription factor n=1 Tax=Shouchella clausii TaxID=79880 RepID=UPI00280AA984|nr:MarR family transcriptional regulator [Shouchella clausii]WMM33286.1 helix-turn-helix domain-containing protein [Shouchella clausii]